MQEGWHYELNDPGEPLTYKGVVFNEMKGAYSSPDGILETRVVESLFPKHLYGVDSGGDPRHIPDLTYGNFKNFWETYYHPSNSFIFFYGNDDPEKRLNLMEGYLKPYKKKKVKSVVRLQSLLSGLKNWSLPTMPGMTRISIINTIWWSTGNCQTLRTRC